ncbi:CDP-glycerol glycerophosphotransferase family protein [Helicobacter rodentium]|uniref:CDP-glycerol glycerophosphotransferase family protein n=7 Tax=Helicobacter rodentium TaxID=59617 RepID=UPI002638D717|nr:CDP-glycerol glycerophosphotransferase family protein [Helicobacter rodentium]
MQKKYLYLYPNGEDTHSAYVVIKELNKQGYLAFDDIMLVDDKDTKTSLVYLQEEIKYNGELWIFHQDIKLFHRLCQNAKHIPYYNGIQYLQKILYEIICKMSLIEIEKNERNNTFVLLNYSCYFLLHFWLTLDKNCAFVQSLKQMSRQISAFFLAHFNIKYNVIGITYSRFSSGKHLGKIGKILQERGYAVIYVVDDKNLDNLPTHIQHNAIYCPVQGSYIGVLLNMFQLYITHLEPHTTPNWGNKVVYVSHAYIDPIASLIQRRRPLDDFWFSKKMGINGYRIVTSLSNYKIFKDKFDEFGYQDELGCGGYPSLDSYIAEYEEISKEVECWGGGNILIAINENDNVQIIYEVLQKIQDKRLQSKSDFKVIFRPHPSLVKSAMYEMIYREFCDKEWFIYDTSSRLSVEVMYSSLCLIGDYSSLVYTYSLCTLKPTILIAPKESLQNTYKGISFYNPILHICAQTAQDIYKALECINQENKQERAKRIKEYREKEVFNLGHSSEFIADFIENKLREIP